MNSAAEAERESQNLEKPVMYPSTVLRARNRHCNSEKANLEGRVKDPPPQRLLLDTLDVTGFGSVDADSITFVDEGGDVYNEAGFQSGRLHDRAGGGFLQGRLSLDNFQVHRIGQIHTNRFFVEEFYFDDGVGNEVVHGRAKLVLGHVHLLVVFRVHEMVFVALVIEVFEFDFIENGALDKFFGAEAVVNHRAGAET